MTTTKIFKMPISCMRDFRGLRHLPQESPASLILWYALYYLDKPTLIFSCGMADGVDEERIPYAYGTLRNVNSNFFKRVCVNTHRWVSMSKALAQVPLE